MENMHDGWMDGTSVRGIEEYVDVEVMLSPC